MTKYIAHSWGSKSIEKVEIEKETNKSYWMKGRRYQKHTNYEKIFETYAEAKGFLIEKQREKIDAKKSQLEYLENELETIKNL